MGSFLKEITASKAVTPEQSPSPRGQIHYGRAHIDGAPFRGKAVPMLRESEFEEFLETVYDTETRYLDMSKPEDVATYALVHGKSTNGVWLIQERDKHWVDQADGSARLFILLTWSAPYKELATYRLPSKLQSPEE